MNESNHFLFFSQNEPFINGKKRQPTRLVSENMNFMALFLSVFAVVGVLLIIYAASLIRKHWLLAWHSQEVTGQIVERTYDFDEGDVYTLHYRFELQNESFTHMQQVDSDMYNRYETGQSVAISYVSNEPTLSRISGTNSLSTDGFFVVFGVIWAALSWILTYAVYKKAWQLRKLRAYGQLVWGYLESASGIYDTDGDYSVRLKLRFTEPETGALIASERSYICNHLKRENLPNPGTPLAIYALNSANWELL